MNRSNARIKEHFGLVTNDTKTTQFSFLVSPPKNRESIEKEDIICLDHPIYGDACQVFAEVTEIASYEEVAGSTIGDRMGRLSATAQIIGYIDLRNEQQTLNKLLVPPNPGSRVYRPYAKFLEDVFNRGSDGKTYTQPIHLGEAEIFGASEEGKDQQVNIYLDAANFIGKHTLISAVDGAGKTYIASVIAEELESKISQPIVILDPNNEYTTIGADSNSQIAVIEASTTRNSPDSVMKKINKGQITIITAENLGQNEKNDFYDQLINLLAKGLREKTVQPFLLLIEDADNITHQTIQEILGPKSGIATILLTSRPSLLGGKVLSQTQTQIIGKTTNSEDTAFLKNVVGSNTEQLSSLMIGEWIICGLNIIRPLRVQVRELNSKAK